MKCDICGSDFDRACRDEFTKRVYSDYAVQGYLDVKINLCEICSGYVKRAKWVTDYINNQTEPLHDAINKVQSFIRDRVDTFRADCVHTIDTEFAKIRTDINRVLSLLDDKLASIEGKHDRQDS